MDRRAKAAKGFRSYGCLAQKGSGCPPGRQHRLLSLPPPYCARTRWHSTVPPAEPNCCDTIRSVIGLLAELHELDVAGTRTLDHLHHDREVAGGRAR